MTGYAIRWSLFTGNSNHTDNDTSHVTDENMHVSATYGNGHEVYMDSYCTSPAVGSGNSTGLSGTVNVNHRGLPKELRPANLPFCRGNEPVFMRSDKMLTRKWHRLTMLSTVHDNSCIDKGIRSKTSETPWIS